MDRETNDLLARIYLSEKNLDQVEPRKFIEWASLEFERGHDLDSLRRLAAMAGTEDLPEVHARFQECVADLGWEIPKKKEVMKQHAKIPEFLVDKAADDDLVGLERGGRRGGADVDRRLARLDRPHLRRDVAR